MSDNPTEEGDGDYIVRDIDIEKEQFMRGFFNRQRDIQRKSLAMVANLAQANNELILSNGLDEIASKRAARAVVSATNIISEKLLEQKSKNAQDKTTETEEVVATARAAEIMSAQHAVVDVALEKHKKRAAAGAKALDNLRTAMSSNDVRNND